MADLSRFKDTKDLNVTKILQMLAEHKVKVMVAGFAMAAVIGGLMIFNGYRAQAVEHQQQMQGFQEKMDVIGRYKRSLKTLNDFFASLPAQLEDDKLITQLTEYAVKNNVDIINYAPGQSKNEKLYDSSRVRLSVSAGSFKDLLAFMRMIERSPYSLRVESFSSSSGLKSNADADQRQFATAEIFISSVHVKQ